LIGNQPEAEDEGRERPELEGRTCVRDIVLPDYVVQDDLMNTKYEEFVSKLPVPPPDLMKMYDDAQKESQRYTRKGFTRVPQITLTGGVPRNEHPNSNFAEFLGKNPNRFRRYRTLLRSMLHLEHEAQNIQERTLPVSQIETHETQKSSTKETQARLIRRADIGERDTNFEQIQVLSRAAERDRNHGPSRCLQKEIQIICVTCGRATVSTGAFCRKCPACLGWQP